MAALRSHRETPLEQRPLVNRGNRMMPHPQPGGDKVGVRRGGSTDICRTPSRPTCARHAAAKPPTWLNHTRPPANMDNMAAPGHGSPPPVLKHAASARTRGEGDASAAWPGRRCAAGNLNGRAKPLDASGGGALQATTAPQRHPGAVRKRSSRTGPGRDPVYHAAHVRLFANWNGAAPTGSSSSRTSDWLPCLRRPRVARAAPARDDAR